MGLLKNASCSIWSRPLSSDTQLISKEAEPPQKPSQIRLSVFMQLFFSHIHKIHSLMTRDAPIRQPLMITGSYAAFRPVLLISGSGLMTPCKCSAAIGCLSLAEKNTKCILEYIFGSTDAYQWTVHWPVRNELPDCYQLIAILVTWLVQTLWTPLFDRCAPGIFEIGPRVAGAAATGAQFITCGRSSNCLLSNPACSTVMKPQWQKYHALSSHSVHRLNIQVTDFFFF